jgi:hypothetical protein
MLKEFKIKECRNRLQQLQLKGLETEDDQAKDGEMR